jgi:carboxyl-terminal processing protease
MRKRIVALALLLALAGSLVATSQMYGELDQSSSSNNLAQLFLFNTILSYLRQGYVEELDSKTLIEGAIKGMLSKLDPHTTYMSPEEYKRLLSDTSGSFGGLGIEITITPEDNTLTVVAPISGTPAERKGIKARDKIIAINGESTKGIDIYDAIDKMRGDPGTDCTITIKRAGIEQPFDVTITREIIDVPSVRYAFMLSDKIGYLRLIRFSEDTPKEMFAALDSLHQQGMQGLVLDLRGNPGGLLDIAVDVASIFLPKGKLIVYTEGRDGKNHRDYNSVGGEGYANLYNYTENFENTPMVVLVDAASASASEILAGALQDNHRAKIIGENTFGKALVQTIIPMPEGGTKEEPAALKMTIAHYYTPNGSMIQGKGITPDIPLKYPDYPLITTKLVVGDYHRRFAQYYLDNHPTDADTSLADDTQFGQEFADFALNNDFHFYPKELEETLPNAGEQFTREQIANNEPLLKRLVMRELLSEMKGDQSAYFYWQQDDDWIARAVEELGKIM